MLGLTLNCLDRLLAVVDSDELDVFPLLVEIFKFFKFHPPENLVVTNIELIFFRKGCRA